MPTAHESHFENHLHVYTYTYITQLTKIQRVGDFIHVVI